MLTSMTGFGRGEAAGGGKKFTVELKAVNHRYCEIVLRLPRNMVSLEERARRQIQTAVRRGRVDGYISLEDAAEQSPLVKVDKGLAGSYYKAMKELQAELALPGEVSPTWLFGMPGVLVTEEPATDVEEWWPFVQQALTAAVDGLMSMRRAEGARLQVDLLERLARIEELTRQIEARSPQVVKEYHTRLKQRLAEWLAGGPLDEARLATEAALFAERSNINEEVVRLYSHLAQMRNFLAAEEAVGRKLDFLLQEMNREINTIASKAGDLEIGRAVVEVKSELEKIREQVQNIE
ncbi:YicC/YloC family endoribonuclease [Desulfotomaculum copahuensis]|uniref:YicC family protein n=1 Tax=Desulfotomaculum copahuensis TaxID=1838280 RepID=A0A1B7LE97_9FIRM|nr:YicC/YloC family endoribonuclease [Desulfotomaculum copahuensis]OAT81428.1 YicC family protein [Desulfotomaculum copahuensis]